MLPWSAAQGHGRCSGQKRQYENTLTPDSTVIARRPGYRPARCLPVNAEPQPSSGVQPSCRDHRRGFPISVCFRAWAWSLSFPDRTSRAPCCGPFVHDSGVVYTDVTVAILFLPGLARLVAFTWVSVLSRLGLGMPPLLAHRGNAHHGLWRNFR